MCRVIQKSTDTAPWPDRRTYTAWGPHDKLQECLYDLLLHLFVGNPVLAGRHCGDVLMIPKGDDPQDRVDVVRPAHALRLLLFKSSHSECIAATSNKPKFRRNAKN
eukprot:3653036-Pyramimonas_sp.AAC.1